MADLGCGVGILGLLCLDAGADHCYAIERGPIIAKAKEAFWRSGLKDRVTFLQTSVKEAKLDRRVDVVICDHVGNFGVDYGLIELLQTARHLHLKTGGRILPQRLDLEVAPVFTTRLSYRIDEWKASHVPNALHFMADQALGEKYSVYFSADDIIGPASALATIELTEDQPDAYQWTAVLKIERSGQINGLGAWFRCMLAEDIWMTNSPLADQPIKRKQVYVPIRPIDVEAGDTLKVTVLARPQDGIYSWDIETTSGNQQSYNVMPPILASSENLQASLPGFVPKLNSHGQRQLAILALCDGRQSVEEICATLLKSHPKLFADEADIRTELLSVLQRNVG